MDKPDVIVTGGFFWIPEVEGCIEETGHSAKDSPCPPPKLLVRKCAFIQRPRWWQLASWWKAWRSWLNQPVVTAMRTGTVNLNEHEHRRELLVRHTNKT